MANDIICCHIEAGIMDFILCTRKTELPFLAYSQGCSQKWLKVPENGTTGLKLSGNP